MTKNEFITAIREMADELEKNQFKFIELGSAGYIFGNRNYGEVVCKVAEGLNINISLYTATEEEKIISQ